MKKVFILYIAGAMLAGGCKKNPLDITPDGRITMEDVFKDYQKTEAYLNTAYSCIPNYFYRYAWWSFMAGVSDECQDVMVGVVSSNMAGPWISGALTTSSNPLALAGAQGENNDTYNLSWTGIRHANIFLENIDKAQVRNEGLRKRMKAEAQLLRAFYYLELVKKFGPVPIIDYSFSASFDYTALKRPTFQQITDFIVADCDAAMQADDLPFRLAIASERGRFTKAVAYSIKSQILLFNASPLWNSGNDKTKWQAAATASREALEVLQLNDYGLNANYSEYFLNMQDINSTPIDKETIFERPEGASPSFVGINSIPSKTGMVKAGNCPTQELVDAYDMQTTGEPAILGYSDADHLQPIINPASGYNEQAPYVGRDPRFYATVWYNGASYDNINGAIHTVETFIGGKDQLIKTPVMANTRTGYYLRKFIDPKIPINQDKNARWKKFRLAEIYLNLAEAENEASGPTEIAYAAIDSIRKRANMPALPKGLSQEEFRERVRRERRVELAIEEHRFYDVRRWKILDQTDKLVTGMEITKSGSTFTYKRFVTERRQSWENKYLVLPLPRTDAVLIPDFTSNQNPGW